MKPQSGLSLPFDPGCDNRGGFLNEFFKLPAHVVDVGATRLEYINRCGIVQHGKEQVFNGHELMPLVIRGAECLIKRNLKFFAEHD